MTQYKTTVRMIDERGNESTSFIQHAWTKYLNGHWTKDMPQKSGRYTVAHRSGRICGEVIILKQGTQFRMAHKEDAVSVAKGGGWDGYYWSEALPTALPQSFPRVQAMRESIEIKVANNPPGNRPAIQLVPDNGQ